MTSTADVPNLTPNQINALVVLMVEARELTNNELKELAGFALTGADNAKLVKLGLVETNRSHRPFSHQLTDEGWRVVRQLHAGAPPAKGGSATRSLLTLLANLHRSLDRLRLSHADFFKQAPVAPVPTAAPTSPDSATAPAATGPGAVGTGPGAVATEPGAAATEAGAVEALVRAAYHELARKPGAWVGLADLREHLGAQDRATVDAALRAMVGQDGVRIIPVANTKSLTARDRAAAVRIGDEENHTLAIGPA
ncbi:hypothetical protein [Micromonospora peucetia]|uniref:MarR family transcriptional regulator n=1 Tax=Micromonospora peucetia TaxID=47871 RepID=A0ABZ1E6Z4_9ACTN|nr:hypothetical protein [Micromonospora peucetia]WSA30563.1 hypothetical protein OIE14_20550 [Micromonospora peucetia]